jgi:hypothetical protein
MRKDAIRLATKVIVKRKSHKKKEAKFEKDTSPVQAALPVVVSPPAFYTLIQMKIRGVYYTAPAPDPLSSIDDALASGFETMGFFLFGILGGMPVEGVRTTRRFTEVNAAHAYFKRALQCMLQFGMNATGDYVEFKIAKIQDTKMELAVVDTTKGLIAAG